MHIYCTQLARLVLSGEHHKWLFLLHSRGSTGTEVGQVITNWMTTQGSLTPRNFLVHWRGNEPRNEATGKHRANLQHNFEQSESVLTSCMCVLFPSGSLPQTTKILWDMLFVSLIPRLQNVMGMEIDVFILWNVLFSVLQVAHYAWIPIMNRFLSV